MWTCDDGKGVTMILHDGTAQHQRHPEPLRPEYFHPLEMELKTLLAYGVDYAGLIRFYNSENAVDGDWTRVFTGDETMVLAHICATDPARMERRFHIACEQPAHLLASAAVAQGACIYRMAARLDAWHRWLATAGHSPGIRVGRAIDGRIRQVLSLKLQQLVRLLDAYPPSLLGPHGIDLATFSPIWSLAPGTAPGSVPAPEQPDLPDWLRRMFQDFYNAMVMVMDLAETSLVASLARRDHEPSMALFIAFCRLLRKTHRRINDFSARRLAYYYRDVLKIQPDDATPDKTFLIFGLDGSLAGATIPEATPFIADDPDGGGELVYTADHALWVNDLRVDAVHTICFEKNRLISPERELGYATDAWLATQAPLVPDPSPDGVGPDPMPLFGASGRRAGEQTAAARLGLAIADPVLLLGQGKRRIDLTVTYHAEPEHHPNGVVRQIAEITRTTVPDAFYKAFKRMFTLEVTTETGWYTVDNYLPDADIINPDVESDCLMLRLYLPENAPKLVPYAAKVHGEGYDAEAPVLRLWVNDMNDLFPYSLLSEITLEAIRIDVLVERCRDLKVYNQNGQLDPSVSFQPFGPLPEVGSYLVVGSHEAAVKHLTSCEVCLEWDAPPGGFDGMARHYRGYDQACGSEGFEVSTTVLAGGRWQPAVPEEQAVEKLFPHRGRPVGRPDAAASTVLEVRDIQLHAPLSARLPKEAFAYHHNAAGGFIKFTLVNPPQGFGHGDYPLLLSRALTAKAAKKKGGPLPNPPYTPKLRSIAMNYGARSTIVMKQSSKTRGEDRHRSVYHLHPLGRELIYPLEDNRPHAFIPDGWRAGNLLIGLRGTHASGPLSLFFHILPKPERRGRGAAPAPKWEYLAANRWTAFAKRSILSDSTRGLTCSGIVTLDLPRDLDRNPTILPEACFWLRARVDTDPAEAGYLAGVAAQALPVTWQDRGDSPDHLEAPLPAGRISRARSALAGIGRIYQPIPSSGGRPADTGPKQITRVSERLRHKNRAITPWDYERLVLEKFPEIFKVKCFGSTSIESGMNTAGKVLVVVIPHLAAGTRSPDQRPRADAHLLNRIKAYLAASACALAAIEVCNPVYEQVQIRCAARFAPSAMGRNHVKRLNRDISRYLSPWSEEGRYPARFGWCIRRADIESYLMGLDYVDYLTRLSLLHIVRERQDRYGMSDTARPTTVADSDVDIHPRYPWGIAVPMAHHYIETIGDYQPLDPEAAGIDELTIGETFIINGT